MSTQLSFSNSFKQIIPQPLIKLLCDKNAERRKYASVEIVRQLNENKSNIEPFAIVKLVEKINNELISANQVNYRKGGLICLCSIVSGLGNTSLEYLDKVLPPITASFTDQDASVRLSACESLSHIIRIVQKNSLEYLRIIFAALSIVIVDTDQSVKEASSALMQQIMDIFVEFGTSYSVVLDSIIRENLYPTNISSKFFVISWISLMTNITSCNTLSSLPYWIDGILLIYSDRNKILQQKIKKLLDTFMNMIHHNPNDLNLSPVIDILLIHANSRDDHIKIISFDWINTLLDIYGQKAILFLPTIFNALIQFLHSNLVPPAVRNRASDLNEKLKLLICESSKKNCDCNLDKIDLKLFATSFNTWLTDANDATKLAVLEWVQLLFDTIYDRFSEYVPLLFNTLLDITRSESLKVVESSLKMLCIICTSTNSSEKYNPSFEVFLTGILTNLCKNKFMQFLSQGPFIINYICKYLDPIDVYFKLSKITLNLFNKEESRTIVENLNIIMLTSKETRGLRNFLIHEEDKKKYNVFKTIFYCWGLNPVSALSLSLLSGYYELSSELVNQFQHLEPSIQSLMQFDHLIQLLESPTFTFLRLRLLDHNDGPYIKNALYGILMILPQSQAFHILRKRLK
ncbi:hypothetical protein HZS_1881, partial [Henneguya salminicola]